MAQPERVEGASPLDVPVGYHSPKALDRMIAWSREDGPWWLTSFVFHMVLVCTLALISTKVATHIADEAPVLEAADLSPPKDAPPDIERFELGDAPEDPTELNTDTLMLERPGQIAQEEKYYDDNPVFSEKGGGAAAAPNDASLGGLAGFDIKAIGPGPAVRGKGGVGGGAGSGIYPGQGGDGFGLGGRGTGSRKAMLASGGGTRQSERAVAAALNWLARHQMPDGSWSIGSFNRRCKGAPCSGPGNVDFSSAATAFGLLPFLGAGQTHEARGPYKKHVYDGISWLVHHQKPNGDLRDNGNMYAHGLAAIALCECYGMTGSKPVGRAAQAALDFIVASQDAKGGGWRYQPGEPGDTSVAGWQIMALKSGQMAYLNVDPEVFEKAKAFLVSTSDGHYRSLFGYQPGNKPTVTMTAVGLLCQQYMHMPRTDPTMVEGTAHLMQHLPSLDKPNGHNVYYWYYATQVMHNIPGPNWDVWNRKMRRLLIDTQVKEGCAIGSWSPKYDVNADSPMKDMWGQNGGRLMMTSLSALTLEVYYRYLPLYKLDTEAEAGAAEDPQEVTVQ